MTVHITTHRIDGVAVEVRHSTRRRKTVTARWAGEQQLIILAPARCSTAVIEDLARRAIATRRQRAQQWEQGGEEALLERATWLNDTYLEGAARWSTLRWSRAATLWGSCTVDTGAIRISQRLQHVPEYVLDAVIVHELVHTIVGAGHGEDFRRWMARFPQWQRAEGFLDAFARYGPQAGATAGDHETAIPRDE